MRAVAIPDRDLHSCGYPGRKPFPAEKPHSRRGSCGRGRHEQSCWPRAARRRGQHKAGLQPRALPLPSQAQGAFPPNWGGLHGFPESHHLHKHLLYSLCLFVSKGPRPKRPQMIETSPLGWHAAPATSLPAHSAPSKLTSSPGQTAFWKTRKETSVGAETRSQS